MLFIEIFNLYEVPNMDFCTKVFKLKTLKFFLGHNPQYSIILS